MATGREPSIGEAVDAGKTLAEAAETGGTSLVAKPMATVRLANEAPKIIYKGIKTQLTCCAAIVFLAIFVGLFVISVLNPSSGLDEASASDYSQSGTLSSKVPPNFATLFKEAASKFNLDPAIVAGIYLTEHHTDSFGKDIPSLDASEKGCSSNSSGARGPMQIIDGTWSGVVPKLKAKGIASPDRCKYRDAIWGGAAVIKGKIAGQPDARRDCKIGKDGNIAWTDACIKSVGRAYCGACDGPACGTRGYNYCDQALRHFKIAAGSLSYLPPQLINDRKEQKCVAINL